ncbi:MAG: hypothetical protein CMP70_01715 [Flavobacteriales bacterium]|nr:hypothetical protein [Flavobacteriales bacterium]|tara:strand:+ start:4935 stop:5324 length:390 start_codon:yes stop_codon:yes gene_type:complete
MTTSRFILSFASKLGFVLVCLGLTHYLAFELQDIRLNLKMWAFTYLSNFLLAALAILTIYKFRISHTASLGYIFLATSLLKLIVFPLFIHPILVEQCPNLTHAFLLFFIPYFVALMVEISVLIKLLNHL